MRAEAGRVRVPLVVDIGFDQFLGEDVAIPICRTELYVVMDNSLEKISACVILFGPG
jgi:hypothetical protein